MVLETTAAAAVGVSAAKVVDKTQESSDVSVKLLTDIRDQITALASFNSRQRQRTSRPLDLSAYSTATVGEGRKVSLDGAARGSHLLVSGGDDGDEFGLKVDTGYVLRWVIASATPVEIDLPLLFPPGAQVSVVNLTDATDVSWRAFLWTYSDRDDISRRYG